MKDHSLPSKKFEPKYKDSKRKTYVIWYPMAMGYGRDGLVGLVTGHFDVSATKLLYLYIFTYFLQFFENIYPMFFTYICSSIQISSNFAGKKTV